MLYVLNDSKGNRCREITIACNIANSCLGSWLASFKFYSKDILSPWVIQKEEKVKPEALELENQMDLGSCSITYQLCDLATQSCSLQFTLLALAIRVAPLLSRGCCKDVMEWCCGRPDRVGTQYLRVTITMTLPGGLPHSIPWPNRLLQSYINCLTIFFPCVFSTPVNHSNHSNCK